MPIALAIILLISIYILYKLFIDGWLFKIILFFAGWFGIYMAMRIYVAGADVTAITLNSSHPIALSWAVMVPTIICFLCLLFTKVHDD
jgi:hypothetical protein